MKVSDLTGKDNYFEDFQVGMAIRHARGKTVEATENVVITNMVMNSAQGHFNEDYMSRSSFGSRLSFGGVNFSLAIGLASQDTSENALAELGMDKIRLRAPVKHGDTLYAFSEVLEVRDGDRPDAGIVRFLHCATNQRNQIVYEGERTVLIKRRSHWATR
jgi:itaconyl-CoA hydratase